MDQIYFGDYVFFGLIFHCYNGFCYIQYKVGILFVGRVAHWRVLELKRNIPHVWNHDTSCVVLLKPLATETQGDYGLVILFLIQLQQLLLYQLVYDNLFHGSAKECKTISWVRQLNFAVLTKIWLYTFKTYSIIHSNNNKIIWNIILI